jgi:hypothetical protein
VKTSNLNIVSSSPILVILMVEAMDFSETSALTKARRRNIPEHGILQYQVPLESCVECADEVSRSLLDWIHLHRERLQIPFKNWRLRKKEKWSL